MEWLLTRLILTKELILVHCGLAILPGNLSALQKLRILEVRYCNIEHINADDLSDLPHLESIDLSRYRIAAISSSVVRLPMLEKLDLSRNYLKEINFKGWNAPKLHYIRLSYNMLTVAKSIFQSFPSMKKLLVEKIRLYCERIGNA